MITFQITCCTSGNRRLSENNIFNERRKDKENDKASCVKKKEGEREHNLKCRKLKEQSALWSSGQCFPFSATSPSTL